MKFSILTACYRGAKHLPRLYESLVRQHSMGWEFEWVLVDDFSNDNDETASLIRKYVEISPFPTKAVFLNKNYYGSRSTEESMKVATGDYVILLDQDDTLSPQALAVFSGLIEQYSQVENFAGVCGRCVNQDGTLIGTPFKWKDRLSNELEIRHVHKIRGELFQCTRRDIVAKYFCNLKPGYTNGHAWTRIARHYQYAYTSSVVRVYNTANPESLSNSKMIRYVENVFESYLFYIKTNVDYLRKDLRSYIILVLHCLRYAKHSRVELQAINSDTATDLRLLTTLLYPFGAYLAQRDCRKGRIAHTKNESRR